MQLIRTEYDPETKKGRNTIVGTVKVGNPVLDPDLRKRLTAAEVAAFESWTQAADRGARLDEELAALRLPETIARARRWLAREGDTPAARAATSGLKSEWQALRKLLNELGLLR